MMLLGSRVLDKFSKEWRTEIYSTCSVLLSGKMWIIGGDDFRRQLSLVDDCTLKSAGNLPFDLQQGAANIIDGVHGQSALLCFDFNSPSVCHS